MNYHGKMIQKSKIFLEHVDKPGPWSEEDDKIHTVGGLTNDKDKSFMKFQDKMDKKKENHI